MNLDKNPTSDQFRALLREQDDHAGHHILWVCRDGEVEITRVRNAGEWEDFDRRAPEMQLRYETFEVGNDYAGEDAANDDEWPPRLFASLKDEWR